MWGVKVGWRGADGGCDADSACTNFVRAGCLSTLLPHVGLSLKLDGMFAAWECSDNKSIAFLLLMHGHSHPVSLSKVAGQD